MFDLYSKCDSLREENDQLREELSHLRSKTDYQENQSRRNNLVFFGIDKTRQSEDWDECEEKVRAVISEGMGITDEIHIERAHRVGKGGAIVVKLLSFKQKVLILKNTHKLKGSGFENVSVREDFSKDVRMIRSQLMQKKSELCSENEKPKLRYDKLITKRGTYTFDLDRHEIKRLNSREREGRQATQKIDQREGDTQSDEEEEVGFGLFDDEPNIQTVDRDERNWGQQGGWQYDRNFPLAMSHVQTQSENTDKQTNPTNRGQGLSLASHPIASQKRERRGGDVNSKPETDGPSSTRPTSEKTQTTARGARRLSGIPIRPHSESRSPVNTRNRTRLFQSDRRPEKGNNRTQTNTLQNWVRGSRVEGAGQQRTRQGVKGNNGGGRRGGLQKR